MIDAQELVQNYDDVRGDLLLVFAELFEHAPVITSHKGGEVFETFAWMKDGGSFIDFRHRVDVLSEITRVAWEQFKRPQLKMQPTLTDQTYLANEIAWSMRSAAMHFQHTPHNIPSRHLATLFTALLSAMPDGEHLFDHEPQTTET